MAKSANHIAEEDDAILQLKRFVDGYVHDVDWQSIGSRGDPQLAALKPILAAQLRSMDVQNSLVVDIGIGRGVLLGLLDSDEVFKVGGQRLLGVDVRINSDAFEAGGRTGLIETNRLSFSNIDSLSRAIATYTGDVLFVFRNVLHEIDLASLANVFAAACNSMSPNVRFIAQDMARLPVAELGQAPWTMTEASDLLKAGGASVDNAFSDTSRAGTPWYSITGAFARNQASDVSSLEVLSRLADLQQRVLDERWRHIDSSSASSTASRLERVRDQHDAYGMHSRLRRAQQAILAAESVRRTGSADKLQRVTWHELRAFVQLSLARMQAPDLILGVARGGLPLSVLLSHAFGEVAIGYMTKDYAGVSSEPFFVFDEDEHTRSNRLRSISLFSIPRTTSQIRRILIVDDVATFGNTLETAERLVRTHFGDDVEVRFFCYAVDRKRLSAAKSELAKRVTFCLDVDNHSRWLLFPWEV